MSRPTEPDAPITNTLGDDIVELHKENDRLPTRLKKRGPSIHVKFR